MIPVIMPQIGQDVVTGVITTIKHIIITILKVSFFITFLLYSVYIIRDAPIETTP